MGIEQFRLDGKVALVTGSTRGIGLGIVEQLCSSGATCMLCSESKEAVDSATRSLQLKGYDVASEVCDVTDSAQLRRLVEQTARRCGGIDILVCNAGITGRHGPITEIEGQDYRAVFDVNLHSMVTLCNLVKPYLTERNGGSIILISSISALRGNAAINAYAMAKAGVAQLARNLAVQWGKDNIRANSVAPGLINTGLSKSFLTDEAFIRKRIAMTPLRRVGEVRDVAACVHFLASDASAFITGQNIVVDGGTVITDGS